MQIVDYAKARNGVPREPWTEAPQFDHWPLLNLNSLGHPHANLGIGLVTNQCHKNAPVTHKCPKNVATTISTQKRTYKKLRQTRRANLLGHLLALLLWFESKIKCSYEDFHIQQSSIILIPG